MLRFRWFQFAPRALQGVLIGATCALLVQALIWLGWLRGLEPGVFDALLRARGPRFPSSQIVLVVADDSTVARAGQWPLPRRIYADVVRHLSRAGAKTIAMDVLFSTPSLSPADDDALVRACHESGRVVQVMAFHLNAMYNEALAASITADHQPLPERFRITDRGADCHTAAWVSSALPGLQEKAPLLGHINVYPEQDGTLRRIPPIIRYRNAVYPSLALAAAAHSLGLGPDAITAEENEVHLAGRSIPLDSEGETWINWIGSNDSFPTFSFNQVLEGSVPDDAFAGRIVVVGVTAVGAFESGATPFSPLQPKTEAQANLLDDVLQNRVLRQAPPLLVWGVLLLYAMGAGALIAPRRALGGTLWIAFGCALLWMGAARALANDLYIPIGAPLLAGVLIYGAVTALNYRREWEANWRNDAAVAALARGGALMASGRDRAGLHAVINQTAREALQAQHIYLAMEPDFRAAEEVALPLPDGFGRQLAATGKGLLWPLPQGRLPEHRPARSSWRSRRARRAALQSSDSLQETVADGGTAPSLEAEWMVPDEILTSALKRLCVSPNNAGEASHRMAGEARTIMAMPLWIAEAGVADERRLAGILVAAGCRERRAFGWRDAVLFQTLAEQAALALENLRHLEQLRGRIELANSDLRQAYDVLAEQSLKLSMAVESIDDAFIISDENGRAIFSNGISAQILRDATPSLGQSVPDMLRSHDLAEIAALFEAPEVREAVGDFTVRCEVAHTQGVSARRVLAAQLTGLVGAGGHFQGAMLMVSDVTVQRELDSMKTEFVSFVAHELRTPLTTILGYASLFQQRADQMDAAQRSQITDTIVRQCQRLNRMIGELLDVSRLEAGRGLDLRRATIDLAELCQRVLDGQKTVLMGQPRLSATLECHECPIMARVDADRMEQVVTNLLSNAIKYSPDGGAISIGLERHENGVEISVRDNGIGMTKDQQQQLFQKFYRTPDARARGIKGTGLGLFLVKQLVEAHDGTIEVESAPGQGTTFRVRLPEAE